MNLVLISQDTLCKFFLLVCLCQYYFTTPITVFAYTPEVNYVLHCQGCHFEDGRATGDEVPALNEMDTFLTIQGGRDYLIQVPGVASAPMTDQELAELMNWVLSQFAKNSPETFKPYTARDVQHLRTTPLSDAKKTRERLLDQTSE